MNTVILILIIYLSAFLIGNPLYEINIFPIYLLVSIYSLIYFCIQIVNKRKIINTKIDKIMVVLALTSFIPVIFNTYVSLSNSVYGIFQSIVLLQIYLIVKNECKYNNKNKKYIINAIIAGITFLCIIGIDEVTTNKLFKIKELVGYCNVLYDEKRLCSLFSYPNAMAAITGLGIFLCVEEFLSSKKRINKVIYGIIMFCMFISFILTYSRLAYIIFIFSLLLFLIIVLKKFYKVINKKIIIITGVVVLGICLFITIGLNIDKPVKIKTSYQKIIYNAQPNAEYNFKFNIKAFLNLEENDNAFKIKITQKDQFFKSIKEEEFKFGNYEGIKEIEFKSENQTRVIYINFEKCVEDSEFTVKSTTLNDNKFILEYLILPTNLVEKIKSISFENKSAWERLVFIKDGLKLFKENPIFGYGKNAWRTLQFKVQSYDYYALQMHSYLIDIIIERGIIGGICLLIIFIFILTNYIKQLTNKVSDFKKSSIIIGLLFLTLHSLLDFDMSYFYIILVYFILIAILDTEEELDNRKRNYIDFWVCICIIISSIVILYCTLIEIKFKKDTENLFVDSYWTEKKIFKTYYNLIPYSNDVRKKFYYALEDEDIEIKKEILSNAIKYEKNDKMWLNEYIKYNHVQ